MKSKLEVERRFLIKLPLNREAQEKVIKNPDAPAYIVQTYLENSEGYTERVRMVSVEMWGKEMTPHYIHTKKRRIAKGVSEEIEKNISQYEYVDFLSKADLSKREIVKTRYFIPWKSKLFELDIFHGDHEGLAILEIELTDMDEEFEIPPFLDVIKEVTGNKKYSNSNLAKIEATGSK